MVVHSQDDLKNFLTAVNPLVTPSNESHICVMVGKSKRQGSGLLVEAGQKMTSEILDLVLEVEREVKAEAKLRVKSIQARSAPVPMKQSGISGSVKSVLRPLLDRLLALPRQECGPQAQSAACWCIHDITMT